MNCPHGRALGACPLCGTSNVSPGPRNCPHVPAGDVECVACEPLTVDGHSRDDRVACIKCGEPPRPPIVPTGTELEILGLRWRIVSGFSTNRDTRDRAHFRDHYALELIR